MGLLGWSGEAWSGGRLRNRRLHSRTYLRPFGRIGERRGAIDEMADACADRAGGRRVFRSLSGGGKSAPGVAPFVGDIIGGRAGAGRGRGESAGGERAGGERARDEIGDEIGDDGRTASAADCERIDHGRAGTRRARQPEIRKCRAARRGRAGGQGFRLERVARFPDTGRRRRDGSVAIQRRDRRGSAPPGDRRLVRRDDARLRHPGGQRVDDHFVGGRRRAPHHAPSTTSPI